MVNTPEELELARKLTLQKEQRRQEVEEQRQVNEDAKTIPCQYCGRTVMQVMAARTKKMEVGEEAGLGGFHEKDGKKIFICVDCGWKRHSPV